MNKLTVLDLFSGIGGFSLGLERTGGFKTVAFCEIDNYCQRVLRKHWPDTYIHSDIRTLGAQHFERYAKPDVICGGFPCQDISVAGRGRGLDGERSGLWFEMLRVIRELRPTWLLIENVPNLRTKGADIVFAGLEEAGYAWTSAVVGAWTVGAPHKRDRVWIVANSTSLQDRRICESRLQPYAGTGCAVADTRSSRPSGQGKHEQSLYPASDSARQASQSVNGSQARQFGQWDIEPNVGRVANGVPDRVHRLRALGNSVVPQIPELFGRFILSMEAAE